MPLDMVNLILSPSVKDGTFLRFNSIMFQLVDLSCRTILRLHHLFPLRRCELASIGGAGGRHFRAHVLEMASCPLRLGPG